MPHAHTAILALLALTVPGQLQYVKLYAERHSGSRFIADEIRKALLRRVERCPVAPGPPARRHPCKQLTKKFPPLNFARDGQACRCLPSMRLR